MLVLAVDDDWDDLELFCEAITAIDSSIALMFANNGEEAIHLLTKKDAVLPDCIFLDINMPIMNGRQCLDKIRSIHHLKHANVIMYSTSITKNDIDFFKERGAGYLAKPLDYRKFQKSISSVFESLRLEKPF